ncbi:MAG: RNA-directed DNA polymerase [Labilithrix sp.]|nr:RNA-directed DNA polymerase [Labilithrix sp.]
MDADEKAKLYRRISSANIHLVLERMRVHGFWPQGQGLPPDPADEVAARAAIEKEIGQLQGAAVAGGLAAIEEALREERRRRWEASKKKRAERKKIRQAQDAERRAQWREEKKSRVVHAGVGVSAGLEDRQSNEEELQRRGLPVLHTAADVAASAGVAFPKLRWLTFHRRGAALVHYHRYSIPKKTGGMRAISAPKSALADLQLWVLSRILTPLHVEPEAHGFVPERSIVTNAKPHVRQRVVVNLDLKDFFPSVTFRRVKGLFQKVGYSEHVATLLALICTEPPRIPVEIDGKKLYVALGERMLPQGACTSPAITNLVCRRLDRRLAGLGHRWGYTYTRYADDLTFSGDGKQGLALLLKGVRGIVSDEGFAEHPTKTRVMRPGRRQEVTGVVVNDKLGVARKDVRQLRAILHNAKVHGLASQNRDNHPNFEAHLRGRIAFVHMIDEAKGKKLLDLLKEAIHG